jgi:hypothetical protein
MSLSNHITELLKTTPDILSLPVRMMHPNQNVLIHDGDFEVRANEIILKVRGIIEYNWLPNYGAKFLGIIQNHSCSFRDLFYKECQIYINGKIMGDCFINRIGGNSITGSFNNPVCLGTTSDTFNRVSFVIPNLTKNFIGLPVKVKSRDIDTILPHTRLQLSTEDFDIAIDRYPEFEKLFKSLKSQGGYIPLFVGEITKKGKNIQFDEIEELFHQLSCFFSFINGRRCSLLFRKGFDGDKEIWANYSSYIVDKYKYVRNWYHRNNSEELNSLWVEFNKIWKIRGGNDFLSSLVHWYVEANLNSGMVEGSIIMSQAALELIYNWLSEQNGKVIEKNNDINNASYRIRYLLTLVKVDTSIPYGYTKLIALAETDRDIKDGADAITNIRNALVHPKKVKRNRLLKISPETRFEALQLSLSYIELAFLNILGYEGFYNQRLTSTGWDGDDLGKTPWT